MTVFKKSFAMFLAVLMIFGSLPFTAFAADNECVYTVETYFMDINGIYPELPNEINEFQTVSGSSVELQAEMYEGFTFDADKSYTSFVAMEDNSSVGKLFYQRNKYKLIYNYEDLLGPQTEESDVYFGAELPGFEANPSGKPAKQGYNFIMWSTDTEERIEAPSAMPSYNLDLYPIYEIKEFTYTFDALEGGTFSNGEQILKYDYVYGDIPEIPEKPVMDNYIFVDWDNDIPSSVTSSIDFAAMYNEVTYFVAFMNGNVELDYTDGYYYGSIIEEIDAPEGFEAWTLSDGTYVEFPYTVEGDTILYAAAAPEEHTAKFYLEISDTEPYSTFTAIQGSKIDFPADPQKTGYDFIGWTTDIEIMPDEDIDFIAEWAPKQYTITFDTDGGTEILPKIFDFESSVEKPVNPSKDGYVFAGWEPEIPEIMPAKDITVTAKWKKTVSEDYLGFKTEIYTYDETAGDWVVADKVERGEKVKARIYIETGFAVSDGQVLVFISDDAFTCDYSDIKQLAFNQSPTSTTGQNYLSGDCFSPSKTHTMFRELIEYGYISEEFLDNHTPITFNFRFSDFIFHKISGEEWFAEFDLTAKSDAVGKGDFFVVPETICNSEEGYYAYITFSRGAEGDSSINGKYDSLFDWNASTNVESKPVSTGYGRITVDADGGNFSSSDVQVMTYDIAVGESTAVIETPVREGYLFAGYEPAIPDNMPEEKLNATALWVPCEDTPFKVIAHYTDFSSGEAIETTEEFEHYGKTDSMVKIVEEIPDNPEEDITYILLSDFGFDYNEFDSSDANILENIIMPDGSSVLVIYFKPVTYSVIFNANNGEFDDGSTVKVQQAAHGELAINVVPESVPHKTGYIFNGWSNLDETTGIEGDVVFIAIWEPETYTLTMIVDGEETVEYYKYGSLIDSGFIPEKEGHEFIGWIDDEGIEYTSLPETMPDKDLVFKAVFNTLMYNVIFDYGYEKISDTIAYGDLIEAPDEIPEKAGYTFMGWYDENGNEIRDFGYMPANNLVFTAQFTPNKYTVTFYYDNTFSDPHYIISDDCDAEYFIPDEPEKAGYKFVQWINAETNAPASFESGMADKIPVDGGVYYAEWEKVIDYYKVSFEVVGECCPDGFVLPAVFDVGEGETVMLPDIPSVDGYEFDGWYYDGVICTQFVMPSCDVVITCRWTEIVEETTTQPTTEEPTTAKPVTTEPTTVKPTTTKPVTTEPTTVKPTTTKPVVTEPTTVKPTTTKPVTTEPTTVKPTETKPVTTEPTTKPVVPTTKPITVPEVIEFSIRKPSVTTISYGDSIILHADIEGELPLGAKVEWTADNSNFKIVSTSVDGLSCTVTPQANGNTVFTATVIDKNGNEIGSDTQSMTSKAGFFQKIIAFFKKLFGLTKIIPEIFKPVFEK